MLKTLDIENLRGIRKGSIQDFSFINILIGPNGCGKSTILESIVYLAAQYSQYDPLVSNHDSKKDRRYLLAEKRNAGAPAYSSMWHLDSSQFKIKGKFDIASISVAVQKNGGTDYSPRPCEANPLDSVRKYMDRLYFIDSPGALTRQIEEALWESAFLSKSHKELQNHLSKIYNRKIEGISYTADKVMLLDSDPCPLRLDDHGAGMRIAFRILLAALMSNGSLLLLEEFDAYQHKTSLERLALALSEIADRHKTQIIMTTHNLETVHAFVTAAKSLNKDLVRIFPLELDAAGTLTTRGMKGEDASNLMASGLDLRDITTHAK